VPPDLTPDFGPEDFAKAANVSRETLGHLKAYVAVLTDWNSRHNLVSEASLADVWRRHVWDSAQLAAYIPKNAKTLVDLGSGAGFPGLVLAELLRGKVQVTLYESIAKKCEFLQAGAKALGLTVNIRNERAEYSAEKTFDVVTARAVAPLTKLLGYARPFWSADTVGLFLKGQNVVAELAEASISWGMTVRQHPSKTGPSGVILEIRTLSHVDPEKAPHPGRRQSKRRRR
jgi:16S rRNA (guanine527-N7)-methyltransferase